MKTVSQIISSILTKIKSINPLVLIFILTILFLLLTTFIISQQGYKKTGFTLIPSKSQEKPVEPFVNDPKRGLIWEGLRENKTGPCKELLEVVDKNGNTKGCTHGPDPAPEGVDVTQSVKPITSDGAGAELITKTDPAVAGISCEGDGITGYRVQAIYVRASDKPDRYSQFASSFLQYAQVVDNMFSQSAAQTGGTRRVRFVTDSACSLVIARAVVSPTGDDTFGNMVTELQNQGYNRADRKYMVWADANVYCGLGTIYLDDGPTQSNWNNTGPLFGRTDSGCWGGNAEAHELMHNLGGVQLSAPHTSGGMHCTDEYDRMCYRDGTNVTMTYPCTSTTEEYRFDCGKNDYFHTNPPAGSYLATHWNTANNRFLIGAPTPTLTPTPTPNAPVAIPHDTYKLINVAANKALNVHDASTSAGTNVEIWTDDGTAGQAWEVIQNADGTYKLINPNSSMALNVHDASTSAGTNVEIWTDNGTAGQKWQFYPSAGGSYRIINPNSNKALAPVAGQTADGTNVIISTINYTSSVQQWKLISLSPTPTPTPTPTPMVPVTNTFPAIADTYVHKAYPYTNYGTKTYFWVDGSPIRITYLKFDLRGLAGKTIINAQLRIRSINDTTTAYQYIKPVSSNSWSEGTMKYSNRPAISSTIIGTIKPQAKTYTWLYTDVTNGLKNSGGKIISVAIIQTAYNGINFYSRESAYDPALIIKHYK